MQQPRGVSVGKDLVCKLKKAIYGLRSSPHQWQKTLRTALKRNAFTPLKSEPNVFHRHGVFLSVYVDDVALFGRDSDELESIVQQLSRMYHR